MDRPIFGPFFEPGIEQYVGGRRGGRRRSRRGRLDVDACDRGCSRRDDQRLLGAPGPFVELSVPTGHHRGCPTETRHQPRCEALGRCQNPRRDDRILDAAEFDFDRARAGKPQRQVALSPWRVATRPQRNGEFVPIEIQRTSTDQSAIHFPRLFIAVEQDNRVQLQFRSLSLQAPEANPDGFCAAFERPLLQRMPQPHLLGRRRQQQPHAPFRFRIQGLDRNLYRLAAAYMREKPFPAEPGTRSSGSQRLQIPSSRTSS